MRTHLLSNTISPTYVHKYILSPYKYCKTKALQNGKYTKPCVTEFTVQAQTCRLIERVKLFIRRWVAIRTANEALTALVTLSEQ